MAEKLREYRFPEEAPGPSSYPWEFWLGGAIVRLEAGRDFRAKPRAFVASARRRAKKEGKTLRVAFEGDDKVVLQALAPGEEPPKD